MEIQDLRLGNLIRISPRPNEEGILFLAEIQPLSIIGVMLVPRQGYHFRIKFNEMLPLQITEDWLLKFGFSKLEGSNIWVDKKNRVQLKFSDPETCHFITDNKSEEPIQHAHQLQNQYFLKTGEELIPKI